MRVSGLRTVTLVLGGVRSGKSRRAQELPDGLAPTEAWA